MSRFTRIGASALVLSSFSYAGATTSGAQPAPAAPTPEQVLGAPVQGAAAADLLGARLDAVAARNGMTGEALRHLLSTESAAWLDTSGRVFFVDPGLPAGAALAAPMVSEAPYPFAETFTLHSKPGSTRVIYLDFDGYALPSGTGWLSGASYTAPAWTKDGSAAFSDDERTIIQGVWQRVAEDFAPFDVDVTTQDPGAAAIDRTNDSDVNYGTRAVITENSAGQCGSCGGVAYLGVFGEVSPWHDYYQPAWVFANSLGPDGEKYIAEATSHEVGHNLGLRHDGTSALGYYTGHGAWAPIMGVGYSQPVVQWSRGEYSGANNSENDYEVMAANGLPERADDAGGTYATGTALGGTAAAVNQKGFISSPGDVDVYKFSTGVGSVSIDAIPAPTSPNLDIKLTLIDSTGTVLMTDDPTVARVDDFTATGLDASILNDMLPGNYAIIVEGVGEGTPSTNYSDYGSLGEYTLAGSYTPGSDMVAPTGSITAPASLALVAKPVTINGNSFDNVGVTSVKLAIKNQLGQWWNGSAWVGAYFAVPATLGTPGGTSTTWTYSFNPPETAGNYSVTPRMFDAANNSGLVTTRRFTTDSIAPTGTITAPVASSTNPRPVNVTGTATDNVGVTFVKLAIKNAAGQWWNGSTWVATSFLVTTALANSNATSTTWSYAFNPPGAGARYTVSPRIYDLKNNTLVGSRAFFTS